jgi:hypothetical protein
MGKRIATELFNSAKKIIKKPVIYPGILHKILARKQVKSYGG